MTDPLDASVDDTFVDRTWMAYSRSILVALAVGALLVRGAYIRDLPVWACVALAVPPLVLAGVFVQRMRSLSLGRLATPRSTVMIVCALVAGAAVFGAIMAMVG